MCQINQREGTVSFAAIRRVLRELFAKKPMGGSPSDPLSSAKVNLVLSLSRTCTVFASTTDGGLLRKPMNQPLNGVAGIP